MISISLDTSIFPRDFTVQITSKVLTPTLTPIYPQLVQVSKPPLQQPNIILSYSGICSSPHAVVASTVFSHIDDVIIWSLYPPYITSIPSGKLSLKFPWFFGPVISVLTGPGTTVDLDSELLPPGQYSLTATLTSVYFGVSTNDVIIQINVPAFTASTVGSSTNLLIFNTVQLQASTTSQCNISTLTYRWDGVTGVVLNGSTVTIPSYSLSLGANAITLSVVAQGSNFAGKLILIYYPLHMKTKFYLMKLLLFEKNLFRRVDLFFHTHRMTI